MYRLNKNGKCVIIGPLSYCLNRLKEECSPVTTVQELENNGWKIEPAIAGVLRR